MFVDSWTWIEFFTVYKNKDRILKEFEGRQLFTSPLNLAEISFWFSRNNLDPKPYLEVIKQNAIILQVNPEIAEKAGAMLPILRRKASGMGMIDAIIYCQAAVNQLEFLTGDPHFINLPNVKFIQ